MFRDYVVDDFNGDEIFCWKDVSLEMMRAFRRSVGVAYHERVAVFGREPSESLKAAKPSGKTSMSNVYFVLLHPSSANLWPNSNPTISI